MEFRCIPEDLSQALGRWDGDTLAVGLFALEPAATTSQPLRQQLAACFGPALLERLEQRGFNAKRGECISFEQLDATPGTLILVGLGEPARFDLNALRTCGGGRRHRCEPAPQPRSRTGPALGRAGWHRLGRRGRSCSRSGATEPVSGSALSQ
jgi:hypothetical protein